jgi:hypothetical protein
MKNTMEGLLMSQAKVCQSCGDVPLNSEDMHGKNADGSINEDYCRYCFPNGAFNKPNETLDEMVESMVPGYLKSGDFPDAESARKELYQRVCNLKRWINRD